MRIAPRIGLLALALLTLAPAGRAATLFGLISTGELYGSSDNGATWTVRATLSVRDAVALVARLSTTDLFLASRSGSVYHSTDGGATWTGVGAVPASDVVDLAIRPDGALLVLTTAGSLYRSSDGGVNFSAVATLTGPNFVSLTQTTLLVRQYALTRTGEAYESADGGTTWTPKGAFAASNAVRVRAVQGTLFALTDAGDLYRSADAGANWTAAGTLSQVGMRGLVANGTSLAAASREGHVATSADGVAWTWRGSMNQLSLAALASNEPAVTTGLEPGGVAGVLLGAPYPNPSPQAVSFAIQLPEGTEVELLLHDVGGRQIAEWAPRSYPAGTHTMTWDPAVAHEGLYFLTIRTSDGRTATRRWAVMR
jgi:photosystem II stability/assembly factor-like uncharacterized protein